MDTSKAQLELKIFFKRINYIHIIAFCLILIWTVNYLIQWNNIWKWWSAEKAEIIWIQTLTSWIPQISLNLLSENIEQDETVKFTYLFSKFDLSIIKWKKVKTVLRDWIKKHLISYEIEWWLETYLNIKEALSNSIIDKEEKGSWVFEVDNLWVFSFYYNDPDRRQTVYQVALIWWKVWWFEYPREKHDEIKNFTKSVADSY